MSIPPPARKPRGPKPLLGKGERTLRFEGMEEILVPTSKLEGVHQAAEFGRCSRCEQPYRIGDWVFMDDGLRVGVNCCAVASDANAVTLGYADPVPLGYGNMGEDDAEGRDFVPMSQVMPSNKTKADMCQRCFMIPSANGSCGC